MTGDTRADYVSINPDSGALTLWHNRCWPKSGTVVPSPGEEDDDDGVGWKDLDCQNYGATEPLLEGVVRWNLLKADQAWEDSVAEWKEQRDNKSHTLKFVGTVSRFLDGPELMRCEELSDSNNCFDTLPCDEQAAGPAEFLILNSIRQLNSMLWNMYDSLALAQTNINTNIDTFAKTFAPVKKETFSIFVILDLATLGYAALAAPVWNRWIKNIDWATRNANDFDTVKDFVNDMTYQGVTLAKDILAASEEALTAGDELSTRAGAMINALRSSLTNYAATIFSGDDTPIKFLTKILASGKLVSPELNIESSETLRGLFERSLYALLIPMAWKLSERELNPFIIDSKMSCSVDLSETDLTYGIDEDAFKTEVVCDTSTDRKYILLSSEDPGGSCSKTFGCPAFKALPGSSVLGAKIYGNVSREDIVLGSLATFNKRSGYNVDGQQSYNNKTSLEEWVDTIENLADVDIRAPYVFTLPICTLTQARKNLNALYSDDPSDRPYYFPCSATLSEE
ncbi:unnamed protein product [Clonostachys rosea]|uniref:Uncharacterized protein n=1 Tax=Bionectria ochroleuca TaxID=29856 RepID=A0ABY6V5Y9_BIOOC|nr:unnamed protein product [Clonostachys rosea]